MKFICFTTSPQGPERPEGAQRIRAASRARSARLEPHRRIEHEISARTKEPIMNITAGERHLKRTDLVQRQMRAHFPNPVVNIAREDALRSKIDFSHAEMVAYGDIVEEEIAGPHVDMRGVKGRGERSIGIKHGLVGGVRIEFPDSLEAPSGSLDLIGWIGVGKAVMQVGGAQKSHQGPSLRHPLAAQQNIRSGFVTGNLSDLADLVEPVRELRAYEFRSREGIIVSRVAKADARAHSGFVQG